MAYYTFCINSLFFVSAVGIVIFSIVRADKKPVAYLVLHTIYRTAELGLVMSTLLFIAKKKLKRNQDPETLPSGTHISLKTINDKSDMT